MADWFHLYLYSLKKIYEIKVKKIYEQISDYKFIEISKVIRIFIQDVNNFSLLNILNNEIFIVKLENSEYNSNIFLQ